MQHICSLVHIRETYFMQFVVFFSFESMKNITTSSEVAQHFLKARSHLRMKSCECALIANVNRYSAIRSIIRHSQTIENKS